MVTSPRPFEAGHPTRLPLALWRYASVARAPNTTRAYTGDVAAFLRWGGSLPCTPELLALFIAEQAPCWAPATLARRIAGIRQAHRQAGWPDPANAAIVRNVLRGTRRVHGRPPRRVAPISLAQLDAALATGVGTAAVRDRALLLLGFAGALRRSELVALDVADIEWTTHGLLLHVRAGKTDVARQGRTIAIARRAQGLCAVQCVRDWIDVAGITDGALFRSVNKASVVGQRRLGAPSVALVVKRHAAALGIPLAQLSGHSLRAGFATTAAEAGVPFHRIQQQTGHHTADMVARYVREADPYAASEAVGNRHDPSYAAADV